MKKLNYILASALMAFALITIVSCSNDEDTPQSIVANTSWQWEDPTHASFFPGSLAREERNLVLYSNGYAQMFDETCIWMGTDTLMHIKDYHHYTYTFDAANNKGVLSLYVMETYQEDTHYIDYMTKDYNFIYDPMANKLTVQDSTVMGDGHKELVERVFDNVTFKKSEQPQLPKTPALTFVAPVTDWTVGIAEIRKYMAEKLPEFNEEIDETIGGTHYYYNNPKETISYEYVVKDGKLVSSSVNYYGMNAHFDYFKSQVSAVFDIWSWKQQPVEQDVHWWYGTSKSANVSIGWSDNYGGYMYADFSPHAN